MTAFIGTAIILTILACIPLTLLFAGRDTNHRNAIRRECQKDALLDWTDKDLLASLHEPAFSSIPNNKLGAVHSPRGTVLSSEPLHRTSHAAIIPSSSVKIESLPRTAFYSANPAA